MTTLSRRSVLRTSLGAAAGGTLVRPYIANAAATTATVWWTQGSAQEEDISFKKIVAEYEKASGNTIEYSITPYAPLRQKIVSAVTSGVVPDLFQNQLAGFAGDFGDGLCRASVRHRSSANHARQTVPPT